MIFVFLGPPGSGKGTQAQIVSSNLGVYSLSTGEILRKKAQEDSDDGRKLLDVMAAGKLVSTAVVNNVVANTLENAEGAIILDGYPRTLEQARFLESKGVALTIIFFDVQDELLVKRLSGRFACSECGKLYNKYFNMPIVDGVCDFCGSVDFSYRDDDNSEVIIRRLQEYKNETYDLIEHYRQLDMLNVIDASKEVDVISQQVISCMKNALTL